MDAATKIELDSIKELLTRIESKQDQRDKVLFGEDGRGGLVADVNATKQRSAILFWFMGMFVLPCVVGIVTWAVSKP